MIVRHATTVGSKQGVRWSQRSPFLPSVSQALWKRYNSNVVKSQRPFRVAVIGSGPAGFYSASEVINKVENATVDMYEQLPVPFGLVRFGVAPDHPEVKNCRDKFTEVAESPNFTFIGNVDVGNSIPLSVLEPHYDAFIFAYGASKDRQLGIPGEKNLSGVYSARAFVGWYNGLPEYSDFSPDLSGEEAVIIGQGNVALDIARMLLSNQDRLCRTDITARAKYALRKNQVKRVHVVGRRGPLQASFTIKEVRELMTLQNTAFYPLDRSLFPPDVSALPRAKKRLSQLLLKGSETPVPAPKCWWLDFCLSPTSFNSLPAAPGKLSSTTFAKTALQGPDPFAPNARINLTDETVTIPSAVAFKSIGYKSEAIPGMADLGIPFDEEKGIIPNDGSGRVLAPSPDSDNSTLSHVPKMYCAGWVKRGPTGVIARTMDDAFETAEAVAMDWSLQQQEGSAEASQVEKGGWDAVRSDLQRQPLRPVSWKQWEKIDSAERERGRNMGKEREKFETVDEMLAVLS